jgi:pilus assembly protein CpaB
MLGNKLALAVSLVCALAASFLVYRILRQSGKPQLVEPPRTAVVFAKKPIPARSAVTAEQLEIRQIPVEAVNPNALREPRAAVGLIARSSILQGEAVLKDRLLPKGQRYTLSLLIPRGRRAVTVAVNEIKGVAGFLKPGDRVDVLGTFEFTPPKKVITWTVIQDAEILAVSQNMGEPEHPAKIETKTASQKDPDKMSTSVTLAATPEQAQQLALSEELGVLKLALRPLLAEDPSQLTPLAETALLPRSPAPSLKKRPTRRAVAPRSRVELISGGKIKYITVD